MRNAEVVINKISVIILIVYAFMAWTGTTLHRVELVIGMHYVVTRLGVV